MKEILYVVVWFLVWFFLSAVVLGVFDLYHFPSVAMLFGGCVWGLANTAVKFIRMQFGE